MVTGLFSPLVLRSGGRLRNRIAKAAMEEGMAGSSQLPDERLGLEPTERLEPVTWSDKTLASAASMSLARHQMRRITRGQDPTGKTHPLYALVCDQRTQRRALGRYRTWLETRA